MTIVSYAQDGEDVLLRRVFPDGQVGHYLDVGANDPVEGSVTKHFYDRGWRGINIEPIPRLFGLLGDVRPHDVNLNLGLSDRDDRLTFYESIDEPGWSTFSAGLAESYKARRLRLREHVIPVTTLARVCEDHARQPIDFLKVDAEGFEREVLAGGDWVRWRPRVVIVEDAWPEQWEHLILGADYLLARRTRMNRFYVRAEDQHLAEPLRAPLGPADDFVLHRHARVLAAMTHRFDQGEDFGPASLRVALWLRRQASRSRALASVVRKLTRIGGRNPG